MEQTGSRVYILPFRGEFGMKLVHHVPAVHACSAEWKLVVCEQGEEALYPSANQFLFCDRNIDALRRDHYGYEEEFLETVRAELRACFGVYDTDMFLSRPGLPKAYFRPVPLPRVSDIPQADIVLCPRVRQYGREKNWPFWGEIAASLMNEPGLRVAAAGAPDSSLALPDKVFAGWRHPYYTDASISLMRGSRLVVATDSGLAHLAVWCGAPLLLISHEDGRVAPGPVRDGRGEIKHADYWPIQLQEYQAENSSGSPIMLLKHSWFNPDLVARTIVSILRGLHHEW